MFTGLTVYDVELLCYSTHRVELTKNKFEVDCYLGKFDLAKQMKDGIDFDLKEKITLPELAKAIGRHGWMYTFTFNNHLKCLVARQAIIQAGFPVFTGHFGSNDLGFVIEDEGIESDSATFLLTSRKFDPRKFNHR